MDIQRILILVGLAVTAYLLVLEWNRDYGAGGRLVESPAEVAGASPTQPVAEEGFSPPSLGEAPVAAQPAATEQTRQGQEDAAIPQLEPAAQPAPVVQEPSRPVIRVKTDVFDVQIDPYGGDIVRLSLPEYPVSLSRPDEPFTLIDPRNDYVARSGLIGPSGTDRTSGRPRYESPKDAYDLGDADELVVPLRFVQASGAEVIKRFRFRRGDYLIGVSHEVVNKSSSDWTGALFTQIKRDSREPHTLDEGVMGLQPYVGGATRSSETEVYDKLEFADLAGAAPYRLDFTDGYMALVQHYFVTAWVPPQGQPVTYSARQLAGQDIYLFGYTTRAQAISPGGAATFAASYYAGPKDQSRLQEIAKGLDLTVDYGFLWWLAQPLFVLMTLIHSALPNWGVAIIGLTIIVKLLLYPLSAASFRSMAKMRRLQPEMLRLKERFGDDRQKFSQAMMELYKKEGANPLGGCFPILLQMPVFLALYWTLLESVELRQAPFLLWIRDLSAMDPYFVLPLLMGVSMYLTQLMQPEPPDPVQAKVFKFMPVIFTFFFLWFPSGLVLYWLVNNILSIAQQWYVTRQIEKQGR